MSHNSEHLKFLRLTAEDPNASEETAAEANRQIAICERMDAIEHSWQDCIDDPSKTIDDFNLAIAEIPDANP